MSQNSPRPPDRKLGLVAPISIAIVAALIILVAFLFPRKEDPPPAAEPPPAPPAQVALAPQPEPFLTRTELLREAHAITAAFAEGGNTAPRGRDPLSGRRFQFRIPFGCDGPQVGGGAAQAFYEFDPEARTIRLVARPAAWTSLPVIQSIEGSDFEAVEGFWVPQPWRFSESCPSRRETPVPATPTPAAAQTLGLARLFEAGGSRVARRGNRPYEHIVKLREDERPPLDAGFRLVLEGRLSTFPSGRVARCWSESPDHRPICLYAVELERVAFEAGSDGRLIAEWRD